MMFIISLRKVVPFILLSLLSGNAMAPYGGLQDPLTVDGGLSWNTFIKNNYPGSTLDSKVYGYAIDTDSNGNIYVAGHWQNSNIFKPEAFDDAYVAKLNSQGIRQWIVFLGARGLYDFQYGYDYGYAIAVDAVGNIYVSGKSNETWGSPVRPLTHDGSSDAFVAKLNNSGVLQWNTFLGGSGNDSGRGIEVDGSGNIYVAGFSHASWGTPVSPYLGGSDAFVAKLNNSGVLQWNSFLGGAGSDFGSTLALDASRNIYMAGESNANAFVAKLNNSGVLQWDTVLGGGGSDTGSSLALDTSGNVYLVGTSSATWGSPARPYAGGNTDAFAAKLNNSGLFQWNSFFGGSGDDSGLGIAIDQAGDLVMTGASRATWGSPVRPYSANDDAFVAKLIPGGSLRWNTFLGGSGNDLGYAIAARGSANIYVTGGSTATWGSPIGTFIGIVDAFAAKIMEVSNKNIVASWDGQGVYYRNYDTGAWTKLASPATCVVAGDLDGDGIDDLIGMWPSQGGVYIRYSSTSNWAIVSSTADSIAVGDMNGDGRVDLVGSWSGQGFYYKDSITGTWVWIDEEAVQVAAGDLDGDGTADYIGNWPVYGGVITMLSTTGTYRWLATSPDWMTTGDMNGDGLDDLLGTWQGQGVFFRDSATGGWVQMATPASQVAAGDVDGDGKDDLIGIWAGQAGVWFKSSSNQQWVYTASTARCIGAGRMEGGAWGVSTLIELWEPRGGNADGPFIDYKRVAAKDEPAGKYSIHQMLSTSPLKIKSSSSHQIPGPGGMGFKFVAERNLQPGTKEAKTKLSKNNAFSISPVR